MLLALVITLCSLAHDAEIISHCVHCIIAIPPLARSTADVMTLQFPFHFIPADGTPDEVATRIRREFAYQAEHDLADVSASRFNLTLCFTF